MAIRHQVIERAPDAVWAVLADPKLYADWVVGTSASWPLDARWPQVDAALAYRVGLGPWTYEGRTVVRRVEPPRWLELEADSSRLGTARIAIEVRPWGGQALVLVDEHPLRGPGGAKHAAPLDLLIQLRHRSMLPRLAQTVERVASTASDSRARDTAGDTAASGGVQGA
ncbi:SRPBCC family protein [Streptomyces mirabilis]|uniref:SRPBCC family protein n=1 Tax=Streptomyces mirabilis TaxID=68239 RepID=UPI003674BA06